MLMDNLLTQAEYGHKLRVAGDAVANGGEWNVVGVRDCFLDGDSVSRGPAALACVAAVGNA
jgi:hypothetical protein